MKIKKSIILKIFTVILLLLICNFIIINNTSFAWDLENKLNSIDNNALSAGEAGNRVTKLMGAIINIVSTIK